MDKKDKLLTISKLSSKLNFIHPNTKKPQNHILRYWEKEFKKIRPKKINNRRYYSLKQVKIIRLIKFLLKNKGMTISGARKIVNSNMKKLDDYNLNSLEADYYKEEIKLKSKLLLDKLKKIKSNGKKNTS